MDILLGLVSAVFWGTTYFIARFPTRAIGVIQTGFFSSVISFTLLGGYLLFSGQLAAQLPGIPVQVWAWLILAASLNTLSSLADFHAVAVGKLSIVIPITANYGIVTVLLSLLTGEVLNPLQFVGIGLAGVGIMLVTGGFRRRSPLLSSLPDDQKGMGWAVGAALGYGMAYWIIGAQVAPNLGGVLPAWIMRINALLLLTSLMLYRRRQRPIHLPTLPIWGLVAVMATLNSGAIIASFIGYAIGNISVVTTLASMYVAVTILLAWVFFKERLLRPQWLGIMAILCAVVLVAQ